MQRSTEFEATSDELVSDKEAARRLAQLHPGLVLDLEHP